MFHIERKGPEINIITISGENYSLYVNSKDKTIRREHDNVVQKRGNYLLFNTGDVYDKSLKCIINGLPQIVQITNRGLFLSIDGNVYKHNNGIISIIPVHNIKQIADFSNRRGSHLSQSAYLDNDGNVFFNFGNSTPRKLIDFPNRIEISFYRNILVMLNKDYKVSRY